MNFIFGKHVKTNVVHLLRENGNVHCNSAIKKERMTRVETEDLTCPNCVDIVKTMLNPELKRYENGIKKALDQSEKEKLRDLQRIYWNGEKP